MASEPAIRVAAPPRVILRGRKKAAPWLGYSPLCGPSAARGLSPPRTRSRSTPFITGAGAGTVLALLTLGVAVRRTRTLPPGFASLPLAMGLAVVPLLIVGGLLESVSERLIELPIALLGLGWIGLGIALWSAPSQPGAAMGIRGNAHAGRTTDAPSRWRGHQKPPLPLSSKRSTFRGGIEVLERWAGAQRARKHWRCAARSCWGRPMASRAGRSLRGWVVAP